MESKHYYEAPSDHVFNDLKEKAIQLWKSYDDTHGYATEKVSRVNELENISDNFMYIFAMFDSNNQQMLVNVLEPETKNALRTRLIAGGGEPKDFLFLDYNHERPHHQTREKEKDVHT